MSNNSHAPYVSATNHHSRKEAMKIRLRSVTDQWLYEMAQSKAADRSRDFDHSTFDAESEMREWQAFAHSDTKTRYVIKLCLDSFDVLVGLVVQCFEGRQSVN